MRSSKRVHLCGSRALFPCCIVSAHLTHCCRSTLHLAGSPLFQIKGSEWVSGSTYFESRTRLNARSLPARPLLAVSDDRSTNNLGPVRFEADRPPKAGGRSVAQRTPPCNGTPTRGRAHCARSLCRRCVVFVLVTLLLRSVLLSMRRCAQGTRVFICFVALSLTGASLKVIAYRSFSYIVGAFTLMQSEGGGYL